MANFTKANGIRKLEREMELVFSCGLMDPSTKVVGRKTKPMAEAG